MDLIRVLKKRVMHAVPRMVAPVVKERQESRGTAVGMLGVAAVVGELARRLREQRLGRRRLARAARAEEQRQAEQRDRTA